MASALWSTARVSVSRWGLRTAGRSMSTGSGNEILPTEASSVTSPIVQGRAQDQPSPKALHHVKLSYLHPDSKTAPEITRPGDMSTGRVRPDPVYVPLSRHVFSHPPRRDLLYASVVYYLDSARKGVASTKTRGEVAFSGAKIRPQKGSGQARLGSRNNPLLRKGGVIHGPKPRDMRSKLNRRVRELALRSALSVRWAQGQLLVVKDFTWEAPPHSSNLLHKLLRSKGWHDALFLSAPRHPLPSVTSTLKPNPKPSASDPVYTDEQIAEHETLIRNLGIATNNMVRTEFIRLHQLSKNERFHDEEPATSLKPIELHAYHILKRKNIICDLGAIEWLEEKLGGAIFHDAELHQVARDLEEIDIEGAKGETEDRYMVAEDIMEKADAVVRSTIRGVSSRVRPNDPLDS